MPQSDGKPDLMATRPADLLALAEEGYESARTEIDNAADKSKELRGWWDRRLKVLEEMWRFERVRRLEAIGRDEPMSEGQIDALRDRVVGAEAPPTGRGEVLQ